MFRRHFQDIFIQRLTEFPVVVVTGARQVGKTTLLKSVLQPKFAYVLLEDPDVLRLAQEDPRTFLKKYPAPVIFDEVQNAPELLNYLQGMIDADRTRVGQYVLTGSQSFAMMKSVSQSLAGRAAILSLYGLTTDELDRPDPFWTDEQSLAEALLRGSFPELWQKESLEPAAWLGSYLRTYIERDVRNLAQVGDVSSFERFVRLCAIRTGQVLNLSDLARDCDISPPTAKHWLSILQQTYLVHLVEPFYENLSSRIRKAPKLYFVDVGMAAYLMGFRSAQALLGAPQLGALFETLVVGEFLRTTSNRGEVPEHCYLEVKSGFEVDLLVRSENRWNAFEIKYTRTPSPKLTHQLKKLREKIGVEKTGRLSVLAPVSEENEVHGIGIVPWFKAGF